MLKILGKASSINVRKLLWVCAELNLAFLREDWGSGFRPTNTPEFLALNPNALVPVIEDDGLVLWESNTICRYLVSRADRHDLLPAEAAGRARVEQWMDWQATDLNGAWRDAFMGLVRRDSASLDLAAIARSVARWNAAMAVLEARLASTGGFVVGEAFTLADIPIGLSVNRWLMTPMTRPAHPAIARYVELLKLRPGCLEHAFNGVP